MAKHGNIKSGKSRRNERRKEKRLNRNYKDYLFRLVFGTEERKSNILSLYNALNGSSYSDVNDVKLTTLDEAMYIGVRNDVSFLIDQVSSLWEHQSTHCPNMPLKGFIYFASIYKAYLDRMEFSMHGGTLVKIPTPAYIVFYNGREKRPAVEIMRLSEAFERACPEGGFEWSAKVYDLNAEENEDLVEGCRPLYEYTEVVHRIDAAWDTTLEKDELFGKVDEAVASCIRDGLLADILSTNRAEVVDMCIQEIEERKYMNSLLFTMREKVKEEVKAEVKEEVKAEVKEEVKAEVKEEVKAEVKAECRAEGIAEGKTEGKAEQLTLIRTLLEKIEPASDDYKALMQFNEKTLNSLAEKYNVEMPG